MIVLVGAVGLAMTVAGWGFYLGIFPREQYRARWYANEFADRSKPMFWRYSLWGLAPSGMAALSCAAAYLAVPELSEDDSRAFEQPAAVILVSATGACLLAAIVLIFVHPRFLMPRWLKDAEENQRVPNQGVASDIDASAPRWLQTFTVFCAVAVTAILVVLDRRAAVFAAIGLAAFVWHMAGQAVKRRNRS